MVPSRCSIKGKLVQGKWTSKYANWLADSDNSHEATKYSYSGFS